MEYSVVIPIHNEEENLEPLLDEIESVMVALAHPWELICVDDGSTDNSLLILKQNVQRRPYLRIVTFTRNFGQSSAFAAGFQHAKGQFVITLDGDRQNDPQDIPKLLQKAEHADLVVGWRVQRKDTFSKRWISKLSNFVRSRFCQDGIHDTGCSLKVFRTQALRQIKLYHGMHRFLPALFRIEGFSVTEVPVHHRQREKGKTKYHFWNRSLGPFLDMLVVRWMRSRHLKYQVQQEISQKESL
ncbi:MAG: glycosyltransferase family 2 protein [Verrucomicrobia bacterium]|nr:glycosyltransferase family 2 protein [Verrucomicrobiota bacterium]MBS0645268.1 glycosyltransferase family 2 protein [Verrucomicrobiota bacterium]